MSVSSELRERLEATRAKHRRLEDAALRERRRQQELDAAYSKTETVTAGTLPRTFAQDRGR